MSKPYCILPWFHQMIQPDGGLIPCCAWEPSRHEVLPGRDEFFHSEFMDGLRSRMASHDPPEQCRICQHKDGIGAHSVRMLGWEIAKQLGIDHTQPPSLVSQDVNLSNICNIKCRTCSSVLSTKWIADERRLGTTPSGGGQRTDSGWKLAPAEAATIRKFEFCGGEPMLHQDRIQEALAMVDGLGRLQQLTIDITTNGMVMPSDEILGMISRTKRAYINISVDGHGALNDYIRSDSDWETVCEVIGRWDGVLGRLPNVYMGLSTVLSSLNANMMEDLWTWLRGWRWNGKKQGIIICYGPGWYDARVLPRRFREEIADRYRRARDAYPEWEDSVDAIINHLSQDVEDADAHWDTMRRMNAALDGLRGADLFSCNPELAGIMRG